jgi:phage terminase small subunit
MGLTAKQENFCQEYMKTGNKSEAYRLAYNAEKMKPETINNKAYELYANGEIRARVSELQKEAAERNKITVDECVSLLASMARFDIADCYDENGKLKPIHEIPKETRLAIESLDSDEFTVDGMVVTTTKKVKASNRRANIVELMKHLGGYKIDNDQKTAPTIQVVDVRKNK